jgi:hypothetical protein
MRRVFLICAPLLAACGADANAQRYGYARQYVFAAGEEHESTDARTDLDPARFCADPNAHLGTRVAWFGEVIRTEAAPTSFGEGWLGAAIVSLRYRDHIEPHQCSAGEEHSCRVTVTTEDGPPFRALVRLDSSEWSGPAAVAPGSLLRVYGSLDPATCHEGVVLRGSYYRHWPRGQYFERWPQR